jgi:hypothetical protein
MASLFSLPIEVMNGGRSEYILKQFADNTAHLPYLIAAQSICLG